MSRIKNTMRLVNEAERKINTNYDMCIMNIRDICDASKGPVDMVYKGFLFGYMRGMRAAKAEMKGGAT